MGLVHAVCPEGIDYIIEKRQKLLFIELLKCWKIDYTSYPRAYRNKRGDNLIPEVYIGGNEYKEVLFDDKKIVSSFFLADGESDFDYIKGTWTRKISIVFMANLSRLYPEFEGRADEKLINDIKNAINKRGRDNRLESFVSETDKVLESLKLNFNNKEMDSMSNFSMCRFNFKILYTNDNKPREI